MGKWLDLARERYEVQKPASALEGVRNPYFWLGLFMASVLVGLFVWGLLWVLS